MLTAYLDPKMLENCTILIIGSPGTGKTTLSLQILKEMNKKALFVSLDSQINHIQKLKDRMEIKTEIDIFDAKEISLIKPLNLRHLISGLEKILDTGRYGIVVFDSIDALEEETPRTLLTKLRKFYQEANVIIIFTKEKYHTAPSIEEYVFDITISLEHGYYDLNSVNNIRIVKARYSPHFRDKYPYILTTNGLEIMLPLIKKHKPIQLFNNYLDEYLPLDKNEVILIEFNETATAVNKLMINFLMNSPNDKAAMASEQVTPERLQYFAKIAFSNSPGYENVTFESLLQSGKIYLLDLYNKLNINIPLKNYFVNENKTPEDMKNLLFRFIRTIAQSKRRVNLFLYGDDIITMAKDTLMEMFSEIIKILSTAENVTTLIALDVSKYDEKVRNYLRSICSYVISLRKTGHAEILGLQKTLFGTKTKQFIIKHTDPFNFELFDLK